MSTSLLSPRPEHHLRPDPEPPDDPRPPRRSNGRRLVAVGLAAAVLAGGGAGAGVVALTGGDNGSASTAATATTVPVSAGDTSSAGLNAKAVYAAVSTGVVEIAAGGSGSSATGSGFVVDAEGHIVTAAHVVDDARSIKVTFADGTTRTATLTGKDDATDVAVLKIDPSGLTLHPLALGSSASLEVGDALAAIGSPFGYEESFSTGIVSGLDRTIQAPNGFTVAHAIQTDAALNPGNSGGPIVDSSGRVIGIADQIATNGSSDQNSGVGFAVPIDLVRSELSDLAAGRAVTHAYLGVATADTAGATGATVSRVSNGGPASDAGLRSGDVVTDFGGTAVGDSTDLVAAIAAKKPG